MLARLALLLAAATLAGCAAVSSVSVWGGYQDQDGDKFKAGVRFDLRAPATPTPTPPPRRNLDK